MLQRLLNLLFDLFRQPKPTSTTNSAPTPISTVKPTIKSKTMDNITNIKTPSQNSDNHSIMITSQDMMDKLIPKSFFSYNEFKCKCNSCESKISYELVLVLNDVREKLGSPIIVTSAYRCLKHNEKVGGAKNSQHLKGYAADLVCSDLEALRAIVEAEPRLTGLGLSYQNFIHCDIRLVKKRVVW